MGLLSEAISTSISMHSLSVVARRLDTHRNRVRELLTRNAISPLRVGNVWAITEAEFKVIERDHRETPPRPVGRPAAVNGKSKHRIPEFHAVPGPDSH